MAEKQHTNMVWQSGMDYYLQLPRSLCAPIQKNANVPDIGCFGDRLIYADFILQQ